MVIRATGSLSVILAVLLSAGGAAQKKDDKKQSAEQRREIESTLKIVDAMAAGQPGSNDLDARWVREDFLKAVGNKQYAPFAVSIDPSKASAETVTFYWRAVAKTPAPSSSVLTLPEATKDEKKEAMRPAFAYEDISFVKVAGQRAPIQIQRSVTLPAGEYDVYVAVKEPTSTQKNAPAPKVSVIKQSLIVPDFWNGELNTSSVIVAERIDPLAAPLTPQQQAERPYAMGTLEIVPIADTKLAKSAELQTFMIIYNTKVDGNNKPDVVVEYNFYTRAGGSEKFFNKTAPQNLNAQTLPPQFDVLAGHQLQAGQGVPLATFPEGDYRLEIKVTDKLANKSLTRDVSFAVLGS